MTGFGCVLFKAFDSRPPWKMVIAQVLRLFITDDPPTATWWRIGSVSNDPDANPGYKSVLALVSKDWTYLARIRDMIRPAEFAERIGDGACAIPSFANRCGLAG